MRLPDLLADIHALEEDILAFERKYGVRSETFYAAYISGEEPADDSWVLEMLDATHAVAYNDGVPAINLSETALVTRHSSLVTRHSSLVTRSPR